MSSPSPIASNVLPTRKTGFPVWLWVWGLVAILGAAALAGRLIWEQTVLTWERGPQMVGFSLAHGIYGFLLLFYPVLFVWLMVAGTISIAKATKRRLDRRVWIVLAPALLVQLLLALPYSFWQRVFASRLAASANATTDLTFAASRGELGVIEALIAHGVTINSPDYEGRTALHNAAFTGNLPEIRYLVSQGANVNILDDEGDSPLELAASEGHQEAAQLLAAHGAKRVRGTDEQRENAMKRRVDQDIQEMDKLHKESESKP